MRREVRVSLVVGLAFALEPAAGDLASGEDGFAIVHGQGEEVDAFPGFGAAHGHEDHGVALADDDGAGGLLGDAARLEGDGRPVQIESDACGIELQMVHEVSWGIGPARLPVLDPSMKPSAIDGQGEVGFLQRSDTGKWKELQLSGKSWKELPIYSYT